MHAVAVIGPGAIGGAVAAVLANSGDTDVVLCARSPIASLQVETPSGVLHAAPQVWTEPSAATNVDLVAIATKGYDSAAAALWLPALCKPETPVFILQNGVDHIERFEALAPGWRYLPAIVDLPCVRQAPGRVKLRRAGSITLSDESDSSLFAAQFAHDCLNVATTEDFLTAAWRKLCFNCAGAVAVVTDTAQGISRMPSAAAVIASIVAECVAVGRAEGAALEEDLPERVVTLFQAAPADGVNSMLADRRAGRPLEVELMNGVVVRKGRARGVPTPTNEMITNLLAAVSG